MHADFTRRSFLALGSCGALGSLGMLSSATAQTRFPTRPITLVDPFIAGSDLDYFARPLAEGMARLLGQPVVVENKPGSGGAIGAEFVARAKPDGYTLLMASVSTMVSNPAVNPALRYDPLKDFVPITNIVTLPSATVVRADSPYKTLQDLLTAAKDKPGTISYASPGIGSAGHVLLEHFSHLAGVKFLHVPYKGAGGAMFTDFFGGQLDVISNNIPTLLPYIQNGKMRALALRDTQRVPQLPEVPTFKELGFEVVSQPLWFGLVATANTPKDVVARLNEVAVQVIRSPEYLQKIAAVAGTPNPGTPEEFRALISEWLMRFRQAAQQAHIVLS